MSLTVPLANDLPDATILPNFSIQANLDNVTYTLEFLWNDRFSAWFMNVLDEQGDNMLLAGIRLVANYPLSLYQSIRQPRGVFMVLDTTGAGIDPGLSDLGGRCQLVYFDAAESGQG